MEFSAEGRLPQSEPKPKAPIIAGTRVEWTLKDLVFGILCFFAVFLLLPVTGTVADRYPRRRVAALAHRAVASVGVVGNRRVAPRAAR